MPGLETRAEGRVPWCGEMWSCAVGEYEVCSAQEWGPTLKPELGNGIFGWHRPFPRKGEMPCVPVSLGAVPQQAEAHWAEHRGACTTSMIQARCNTSGWN